MVSQWQLLVKKAVKILYIPAAFGVVFAVVGIIAVANRDVQYTARSLLMSFSGRILLMAEPADTSDSLDPGVIITSLLDIFWSQSVLDLALADLASSGIPANGNDLTDKVNVEGIGALNTFIISAVSPDPYFAVSAVNAYSDAFTYKINSLMGWEVVKVIDYSETAYPAEVNDPPRIVLAFALFGVCLSLMAVLVYALHGKRITIEEDILSAAPIEQLIIIPRHDIK